MVVLLLPGHIHAVMELESLPTVPRSEELIDKAFSRAARAGRAKHGTDAQESMLRTAGNILADNLANVAASWPDFDSLDPFYYEVVDSIEGIDELRQNLGRVTWASNQVRSIESEYHSRVRQTDVSTARKYRKQAFARYASVVREVSGALEALGAARNALSALPDIRPDVPTIVVAGYPNVGKSSFVNAVTNARGEIDTYPFTTTEVHVGHVDNEYHRYQIVDTPGLLDRPSAERNDTENQAVSALTHLADCILFLVDPSETCGYPMESQLSLREEVKSTFSVPVITVANKQDLVRSDAFSYSMSIEGEFGVEEVLQAAMDAIPIESEIQSRN